MNPQQTQPMPTPQPTPVPQQPAQPVQSAPAPQQAVPPAQQVIPQNLQAQIPNPIQARANNGPVQAYGATAQGRAQYAATTTAPIQAANIAAATGRNMAAAPVQSLGTVPNVAGNNLAAVQPPNQDTPISTQTTLLISELRDSVVIMKDGSFRAVVACQSINFDLMSNTEREGVEYSYQNFLNSLNFTIQILIRSQRIDISPYIDRLSRIRRGTDNMLLGVLMDDYIDFINVLAEEANIMDKSFFIVIPYYSTAEQEKEVTETKNFFTTFSRASKVNEVTRINRNTYDTALDELSKRVDSVISGLFQIGIKSVRLDTRGLSALYYNFNNPDTALREPLVDFSSMATTFVKGPQNPNQTQPPAGYQGGYNG